MDNTEIIKFIENELTSISIYEFLTSNYNEKIISKLTQKYRFNSSEELRNFIVENGPNFYGFYPHNRKWKEKELQELGERLSRAYSIASEKELQEKIDSLTLEIEGLPTEEEIVENEKKERQTKFILKILYREELRLPHESFFKSAEEKNRSYEFFKLDLDIYSLKGLKFNNIKNEDIKNWRKELLELFTGKLPQIFPISTKQVFEPALLALKNGLLFGQAIITNDNTVCLNLSDGIMVRIDFYKKKLTSSESRIYSNVNYKEPEEIYSTGGYATKISLPNDLIFVTEENVAHVSFEASPLLNGFAQFNSSSIVPVIEKLKEDELLKYYY